jgi:adenylate cyclase
VTIGRIDRRLAAVLAADVAGYSRLMGADEVGTLEALKSVWRDVVDPAIAGHKGRIVKTTGDGLLAEFGSVVDAVTCAMTVQGRMAQRDGGEAPKIMFRIGINVGDIIIDGEDIFGDGVNVATRVENECQPGGVCLSDDAFRQVRGKTAFAFDDLGEKSLKNIDRPVRLYAVRSASPSAAIASPQAELVAITDRPSIAVLPFQNMSGDPEQEYFADGMVEDIITALSRFKSLFVIARNSSFTYKGKAVDIKQIGSELGVRYLLEGSVRKSGGRVRITGQLIEAATGAHLWADKIDGALDDVFELQDQVTQSVVGAILPRLWQAEMAIASRKPRSSWNCYDKYLRGNALLFQLSPATLAEAREEYAQALSLDPDFAPALAALASSYVVQRFFFGQYLSQNELAKALELSARATELAPDDGLVLARCAFVVTLLSDDLEKGMNLAERAVNLNPNIAMAWTALGWIWNLLGEPERAWGAFSRAERLNPLDRITLVTQILPGTCLAFFLLGRQDELLVSVNRLLALDPNNLAALLDALHIARQQGRSGDAEKLLQRIEAVYPGLRSSQVRHLFRRFRKPEHQELFDRWLSSLLLPA